VPLPDKCPLCKASDKEQSVVTSHVYSPENFVGRAFYHCHNCDVRHQYPRLTVQEENHFYKSEFESFMDKRSGDEGGWKKAEDHIISNEETRLRRMKYLLPNLKKNMNILEIGCSSGFMLYPLIKEGYDCIGVEPSGVFSDFVKDRGLKVFNSINDLIKKGSNTQFDLIMHYFVLEHISDPISFLESQLELLKPGGKIIFEIPNIADPLYSIYDIPNFERFYWSIAHPWYFSEKSLKFLLNQISNSFNVLLDQRYDLSNHMVWARDGKPGGMGRFTESLTQELENSYKEALIRIRKCDTLIGIINKQ